MTQEKIILPNTAIKQLSKRFNLQNVVIKNALVNPYANRLNQTYERDEPIGTSVLGTPIFTDLTLKGGFSYIDNISGNTVEIKDDIKLETILMTIDQPIRAITTEIQGRDGSVKEYIGKADTQITINGMICGKSGVYPKDQIQALKKWLDAPVAKEVVAWWLNDLGVQNIVIISYSMPQTEGYYSTQYFSISAISDLPVELRITTPL